MRRLRLSPSLRARLPRGVGGILLCFILIARDIVTFRAARDIRDTRSMNGSHSYCHAKTPLPPVGNLAASGSCA